MSRNTLKQLLRKKIKLLKAKAFKFKLMNLNLASANITEVTELMEHGPSGELKSLLKKRSFLKLLRIGLYTLLETIKSHVLPGSIVATDDWTGYKCVMIWDIKLYSQPVQRIC